jgi:hypothetical protein
MSALAYPIPVSRVIDSEVDFPQTEYLVRTGSSLKSFNVNFPNSYSNSSITTKLEVSNSQMLIEKMILWEQPVSVSIVGSTSTGINILQTGAQAPRSHALAKASNTINLQFGNASYTYNASDVISAFERYNLSDCSKYNSDIDLSMLDQYQSYDSGFGSNRSPLQLYSSGMNAIMHRGSQPLTNIVNSPTAASFDTVFRCYLPVAPLNDQIQRNGGGFALSHLDNLNIDINFVSNLFSRMFSFCRVRNGDTLTITNGSVVIGQPVFRFVQLSDQMAQIPPVLTYPLNTVERYNTDFTFSSALQPVASPVIQTSRFPHSMYVFARPTNSVLLSGYGAVSGAQVPDAFCGLNSINVTMDGQVLASNADVSALYKLSSENGLVDSFIQYSAQPLLVECSSANGTYAYGAGSVTKFVFNKDICLQGKVIAPGMNYKTNLQVNAVFSRTNPSITNWSLYIVLCYSDILQLYGQNNALINNAPISEIDVSMANKANPNVHYDVLREKNISGGAGLLETGHSLFCSRKVLPYLRMLEDKIRSKIGGAPSGGAFSGGAVASKAKMSHKLLM